MRYKVFRYNTAVQQTVKSTLVKMLKIKRKNVPPKKRDPLIIIIASQRQTAVTVVGGVFDHVGCCDGIIDVIERFASREC